MKKSLLVMVAMFFVGSVALVAQDKQDGQKPKRMDASEMAQHQTDRMAKSLSLNDSQKEAVLQLNKEYMSKMRPGNRMGKPDNQANASDQQQKPDKAQMQKMREEMQASRAEYETKLKAILTADQFAQYQKEQQDRMNKHRGGQQRGPQGGQQGQNE